MMVDDKIPECIECKSTEVVVHKHDVAAFGDTARKYVASYECVECGRQWQPITELSGQGLKPLRRYS
jgi:transposase-like protein